MCFYEINHDADSNLLSLIYFYSYLYLLLFINDLNKTFAIHFTDFFSVNHFISSLIIN